MGSKTKKRPDAAYIFQQAKRWFEKKNYRQALKEAKVCYRQEPNEERRFLLERAYLARARELLRAGLRRESLDAVQGLMDLGVTEPSVKNELTELLLALGLFDKQAGPISPSGETDPLLLAKAADHAVVRPEESPASLPGIREGAKAIRAALQAIEGGDERTAQEILKDIPRGSPFADWKLFVRGLAAYYRQNDEEMGGNWSRLDPGRIAARIAAPLSWLADPKAEEPPDQLSYPLRLLEKQAWNESISDFLASLQGKLADERLGELFRAFKHSLKTLQSHAPEILSRLEELLYGFVLRKGEPAWLKGLSAALAPPPLDPHWNRAWALLMEHPAQGDLDEAQERWKRYLRDLENMPSLAPDERALAQALVWERLGEQHLAEALELDEDGEYDFDDGYGEDDYDDDECEAEDLEEEPAFAERWDNRDDARKGYAARAVECLGNAVRLAPNLLSAHEHLAEAHVGLRKEERAAEAYRQLLAHFPEHYEALKYLIRHHLRRDECFAMRDYALRALRLKPANEEALNMAWSGHLGAARLHALRGEWELGRAEFAAADKLALALPDRHHYLAKQAAFEFKAGRPEIARGLVAQSREHCPDPAALSLVLMIEAIRYQLPVELDGPRIEFENEWQRGLKKKKSSKTAGQMARTMLSYLVMQVDYPARDRHVAEVAKYVRACSRLRWQSGDLEAACFFFSALPADEATDENYEFAAKLAAKGTRNFPENPVFWQMAGIAEIDKGPYDCRRWYAKNCFEKARDLAKKRACPQDAEIVKEAERRLSFLSDAGMAPPGFSFPPPDFGGDDRYDDEYDDDPPFEFNKFAKSIFDTIKKMAKSMGVNPNDLMDELDDELPPQFAPHFKAAQKLDKATAKEKGKR